MHICLQRPSRPVSRLVMSADGEFPGSQSSAVLMSFWSRVNLWCQSASLVLSDLKIFWTSAGFLKASVIFCTWSAIRFRPADLHAVYLPKRGSFDITVKFYVLKIKICENASVPCKLAKLMHAQSLLCCMLADCVRSSFQAPPQVPAWLWRVASLAERGVQAVALSSLESLHLAGHIPGWHLQKPPHQKTWRPVAWAAEF